MLSPTLPLDVLDAARAFAAEVRSHSGILDDDWLNNGPASLIRDLPPGWEGRLQPAFAGAAIELRSLGREELLRSKLFALCDRGLDLGDCLALAPTPDEAAILLPWLEYRDANPDWPQHVRDTLRDLLERLGHGV